MDNINEIRMIYEFNEDSQKIRIFGDKFVENNKNIFEIKLRGLNNVSDISEMFYDCSSLKELPDISKWNTSNVTNMFQCFIIVHH